VTTAAARGWNRLTNGVLLKVAEEAEEAEVDLLLTTDRRIRYQQNLANRKIAIAVVLAPQNGLACACTWTVSRRQ
jgi:hypothetical protein